MNEKNTPPNAGTGRAWPEINEIAARLDLSVRLARAGDLDAAGPMLLGAVDDLVMAAWRSGQELVALVLMIYQRIIRDLVALPTPR